jgi:hypothetical protein
MKNNKLLAKLPLEELIIKIILIHAIQEKLILVIKKDKKNDNFQLFLSSFYLIFRKKKLKEKILNLLGI